MGTYSWHSLFELPGEITNLKKKKKRSRRSKNSAGYAVDWYQWGVARPRCTQTLLNGRNTAVLGHLNVASMGLLLLKHQQTGEASFAPATAGEGSSHFWRSFLSLSKRTLCCRLLNNALCFLVSLSLKWGKVGNGEEGYWNFKSKQTNKKKNNPLIETILGTNLGDNWRNWVGGEMIQYKHWK